MPSSSKILRLYAFGSALLVAFLSVVFALDSPAQIKYLELTHKDFVDKIHSHDALLVMFKVTWCGHCKKALEGLEIAAAELAKMSDISAKINFATVDCTSDTQDKEICDQYQAKAYPKFVLFDSGIPVPQDDIDRDPKKLLEFILKFNGDPIQLMTGDALTKLIHYNDKNPMVVAYFKDQSSNDYKELVAVAKKMRTRLGFGVTMDPSVLKLSSASTHGLAVFRKMEEPTLYNGAWDADALTKFVEDESVPLVGEIEIDLFQKYMRSNKSIFYFFYTTEQEQQEFMPILKKMATLYRETLNIGFINTTSYGGHGVQLGLKEHWPAIIITETKGTKKWVYDQGTAITSQGIESFLKKQANNENKAYLKSEPVPVQSGHVREVVASTFDEVLLRPNQDVLMFYHAPWCGHCKKFAPTYAVVAEKLAHISDSILIAKINADKNDIPESAGFQITGFPTIALYNAVTKKPIKHDGDRTVGDILQFLKKNAHHKDKITTDISPEPKPDILDNEEL